MVKLRLHQCHLRLIERKSHMRANAPPAEALEAAVEPLLSSAAVRPGNGPPPDSARKPYPLPAELPTQLGAKGIRFDFNQGARVVLPNRESGAWRVRLSDLDTGNI